MAELQAKMDEHLATPVAKISELEKQLAESASQKVLLEEKLSNEQEKEKQHLETGQELNSKISALEEDLASIRGSLTTAESERDKALQECVINFTKFVV